MFGPILTLPKLLVAAAQLLQNRRSSSAQHGAGGRPKVMRLATPAFIRRFLIQVLPDGFRRIRPYELLARPTCKANFTKNRALLCAQCLEQAGTPEPEPEATPRTLREPCPCCCRLMRITEIFRER